MQKVVVTVTKKMLWFTSNLRLRCLFKMLTVKATMKKKKNLLL
jgi:hypothetical protein